MNRCRERDRAVRAGRRRRFQGWSSDRLDLGMHFAKRLGVKQYRLAGILRLLFCAAALLYPHSAAAASWQWTPLSGRERVDLVFDAPLSAQNATRTGERTLSIDLGTPADAFTQTGAGPGKLVTGVDGDGSRLVISLRDPAFGYVVSRPDPRRLRIDVFPDPLGARWTPNLGAPGVTTARAPQTSPQAPAQAAQTSAPTAAQTPSAATPTALPPQRPETPQAASAPVQAQPAQNARETQPAQTSPAQTPPTQAQPAPTATEPTRPASAPNQNVPNQTAQAPVQAQPVQAAPVQTPPVQTPPVQDAPAQAQSTQAPQSAPAANQTAQAPQVARTDSSSPAQAPPSPGTATRQPLAPAETAPEPAPAPAAPVSESKPDPREVFLTAASDLGESASAVLDPEAVARREAQRFGALPARAAALGVMGSLPLDPAAVAHRIANPFGALPSIASALADSAVAAAKPAPPSSKPTAQAAPPTLPVRNPAKDDPRTAGLPVLADGQGLVVTNEPRRGQVLGQENAASPAEKTADRRDGSEAPSLAELTRLTQRLDATPGAASSVSGPLGGTPENPVLVDPDTPTTPAPAARPAPAVPAPAQPASSGIVETPLGADGAPAGSGVSGRIDMRGLGGGLALPQTGPSGQSGPSATASAPTSRPTGSSGGVRARINLQGPEAWPDGAGLGTSPSASGQSAAPTPTAPLAADAPATAASATSAETPAVAGESAIPAAPAPTTTLAAAPAQNAVSGALNAPPDASAAPKEVTPERPVIYVNEEGQEVPKPPDSQAMIEQAQTQLDSMQYQAAKKLLDEIKTHVLTPEQRERVLYQISDALYGIYTDRWLEGYEPITASTNEAMNFNLKSERVPDALFRLGMLNLLAGNQSDALGYFGALRRNHRNNPNVPIAFYRLGKDMLDKQQYADAIRQFQLVMDEYPESKSVRESARYMAEALYRQGHYDRANVLVDFVDRRWPRLYIDDPAYLAMVGDIQARQRRYNEALQTLWTYYNLLPENPNNHKTLLDIGTIYLFSGLEKAAQDVFEELLRKYPQTPSAPVALLRMGEGGIVEDRPSLDALLNLYGRPGLTVPEAAYRRILSQYPNTPEAETAELRSAAWRLWNKDVPEAMAAAATFIDKYPTSPLTREAKEIILRGFDAERKMALDEENYERLLALWERYPDVRAANISLDDDLRVGLARAHLNRGEEAKGIELLSVFLDRPKDPKYGDYVYNLMLAKLLRDGNWAGILDLGDKLASWPFPKDQRDQLDYSMAISAENLGLKERALPIWQRLYAQRDIPLYQRAYATYFLARDAEQKRNLSDAYKLNLESHKLFTQLEAERSDKADPARIRESLAALMDVSEVANRYAEALEWAEKYSVFVPMDSPDYAGLLFRRARLHRKMGDLARWRSQLEEIVAREPDSVFGGMAASELRTHDVARDLARFAPPPPPEGKAPTNPDGPAPAAPAQGQAVPAGE